MNARASTKSIRNCCETFEKLGIPLPEQKQLAASRSMRCSTSVSVATTFKEKLAKHGIIFCSFSEAVRSIRSS